MGQIDFVSALHKRTPRDYLGRVCSGEKAALAEVAKQFGEDYWDGDRKYGYGGFRYDGRWEPVARAMIDHYKLDANSRVLDVGCGKAFLLYELWKLLPGLDVRGVDISEYALEHAKEEMRPFLTCGDASKLPYEDATFDLVLSLNTLHNLYIYDLEKALHEIMRVKKPGGGAYVVVESYRNEEEKTNMINWQLTCECFFSVSEWEWVFRHFGYDGDYSFTIFE